MLHDKQLKTITMMITGEYTIQEIAEEVGVSNKTIHNWKTKDNKFIEKYEEIQNERVENIKHKFMDKLEIVTDAMLDIITDEDSSDRDIINASKFWIDRALGKPKQHSEVDIKQEVKTNYEVSEKDILDLFEEEIEKDE